MIRKGNYVAGSPGQAARSLLRGVPLVMRTVRAEMRARGTAFLSVPQFRALNFVDHHPEASLSEMAAHIGVTLPSMSRLVDGLADRKLLIRRGHAEDRRRLTMSLTGPGRALLQAAHEAAESALASRLSALGSKDLTVVVRAMEILHSVFAGMAQPGRERNP